MTAGLLSRANTLLAGHCRGRRVTAFAGPTVNRLYGERLRSYLGAHLAPGSWTVHVVRTGERYKTMDTVERICALAKADGLDRQGIMLALGGGVLCDMVGFAASMYARGIRYIKVNTTLVGQVDVGVGIKTGVNACGTKNLLGAYHPAHASINDPGFLRTLPARQIRCGLAEIAKMAVIKDAALFETLERHPRAFQPGTGTSAETEDYILRTAMVSMLRELCPNLREHDLARLVDFGHTFGPVIETASGYAVAHGESVAIDMALSSHVARLLGLLSTTDCERIVSLLHRLGLPAFDQATCTEELMAQALRGAWERRGRRLHLVVPHGIGTAGFVENVPPEVLRRALAELDQARQLAVV